MRAPRTYRKRPVEVQAIRFDDHANWQAVQDWITGEGGRAEVLTYWDGLRCLKVHTLEGEMLAQPGDWIVKGMRGEFYPVEEDVFGLVYEVVR